MKTINTTSEFKASEKGFGFNPKIRITLSIDGIFNVPHELKKMSVETGRVNYSLYFLGQKIEGGKFAQRLLTDEELEAIEIENQGQQKNKKKEAIVFEDTDQQLHSDMGEEEISSLFEEFENKYKFSSVKFSGTGNGSLKFEEDLREADIVLFEESLLCKEGASLYLIVSQPSNEDNGKRQAKVANDVTLQNQIYRCFIDFQALRQSEASSLKDRYFLTPVNQTYIQNGPMYIKLEFKTDVVLMNEYKTKFPFDVSEILRKEEKNTFPGEIIEQRFIKVTEIFYQQFSDRFNEIAKKTSIDSLTAGINGLGSNDKLMTIVREISDGAKSQLQKENQISGYKSHLNHMIASQVFQKHKIKDLKGVYFNNNDQIYGDMYNLFTGMLKKFKMEHIKTTFHERGQSVPQNNLIQSDYLKAVESRTGISSSNHFETLARDYFLLGFEPESSKTIERVLTLDQQNQEAFYFKLYQKLSRKDFVEAENLILTANGKWGSSFEANYRLLLFFIDRLKIKEAVFVLRYMLEKFPNDRLFYSWLLLLGQKYLESSSLTAYFQAKFNRIITKNDNFNTTNSESTNTILSDEIYKYDFLKDLQKANTNDGSNNGDATMKVTTIVPENEIIVKKKLKTSNDEFYMNEAKLAISWGFSKAATMLLDQIEERTGVEFKLLEYQIANLEDPYLALEKMHDLHLSEFSKHPIVLYELFLKLVQIGFNNNEDESSLLSDLYQDFENYNESQQHFISYHTARILFRQGKIEDTIQVLLRGIEKWPNSVPEWILLGKCLCFKDEYTESLKVLSNANLLDNLNYEGLVLLACCLLKLEDKCRIHPVLQDIRTVGVEDGVLTLTLIQELEANGMAPHADFFKRNYFAIHSQRSN
jgi:hypothetical protein